MRCLAKICLSGGISFIRLNALPLLIPASGWVSGLLLARIDFIPLAVSLSAFFLSAALAWKWQRALFISLCAGLAVGLITLVADVRQTTPEGSWLEQKIGIIATIEEVTLQSSSTRLLLTGVIREDGQPLAGLLEIYLYRNAKSFRPGMQINAQVKLHLPHNKLNPVGFDYESYAFARHVAAIGSASGEITVLSEEISLLENARARIRQALHTMDKDAAGVLSALLLAERTDIPVYISDGFAAGGVSHMLAISGLHVGLVAGWGYMLAWWLITRRENWIVRYPVRTSSLIIGLCFAFVYATLAAWPLPAQRAFLMFMAGVVAWTMRAHQIPLNTMLAALMLITLLDPASVLSVSLWLSFLATAALLIWIESVPPAADIYQKLIQWLKTLIFVSIVASLATLPLIAFVFERLPVWSVVVNVLLVPLYSLYVLPLALLGEVCSVLGLTGPAVSLFELAALGIVQGNDILLYMQSLPLGNVWLRGDLPLVHLVLALLIGVAGMLWLKRRVTSALLVIGFSIWGYAALMLSQAQQPEVKLYAWDVGQGASSLLSLGDFQLLLDAPGRHGSKFNGGTTAAENGRALGILNLNAVVVSHAQSDHAGGLKRLLASMNGVGELWLADVPENHDYPDFQDIAVPVRWLKQGDAIQLPQARVDVLWPPQNFISQNRNNDSLVLLITLPTGQSILLPGDIEQQVEQHLAANLPAIDLLLMPHHGSNTSSTEAFVKAAHPKIAIAQTGYKNFYGFPKEQVVKRYIEMGSRVWNTAEGAVTVTFTEEGMHTGQQSDSSYSKRKQLQTWFLNNFGG